MVQYRNSNRTNILSLGRIQRWQSKNTTNKTTPKRNRKRNAKPTTPRTGEKMKPRYEKINDYYIQDNFTGQKLDQKRAIRRLNKYEHELRKETKETI